MRSSSEQAEATLAGELGRLAQTYVVERTRRREFSKTSSRTVHYALGTFVSFVGWEFPVRRVKKRHIERWMERAELAPATRRCQLSIVRRFFAWLLERGDIAKDPTTSLTRPRQPRYVPRGLTLPRIAALLDACPDARASLIVTLMVQQGLRCAEVAGLELGDIDPDERLMLVRGKGEHERVLPITDETWATIGRYLTEYPASAGPLVRSYRFPNRPISAGHVSVLVGRWMTEAGIDGSAHALRHSCATDMLRAGAHVRDVQQALGHQSLATTQRYMPWVVGDLRKAMGGRNYRAAKKSPGRTGDDAA